MNVQDILERLEAFDTEMFLENLQTDRRINIVIIGGAALLLHQCIQRSTNDIDIIQVDGRFSFDMMEKYDMDTRSMAFFGNFSDTMDERYQCVPVNTKVIDYYIPSLEDLVISKLSSDRGKDTQDVMQELVFEKVNLVMLDEILSEIHLAIFGHSLVNLRYGYEEFKQRKEAYEHEKGNK
jgi:hypothetical protein